MSLAEAPLQLSNFYNEQWDDDGDNDAEFDNFSIEIYHAYSFQLFMTSRNKTKFI